MNLLLRRFGTVGAFASSGKGGKCWYIVELMWEWSVAAVIPLCWALFKIIQCSGLIWSTIELKSVSGLCSVPMVV